MSPEQIIQQIKESKHNKIRVAIVDIDGILRGKVMHRNKFLSALEGGFGFCDVVFGWDMADELYDGVDVTGWHTGFPDAPARIDISSYRTIPWQDNLPTFLADFGQQSGNDLPVCPRSLLRNVAKKCRDMGYVPVFSQEFEWFNFEENSSYINERKFTQPYPLTHGMFGYSILRSSLKDDYFNDLFDQLELFDIPLEGLHTETGPGVYEAAIQYSEIEQSADRAALFKTAVKEIAYKHGILATFMAKYKAELPGCSGHVHQSLWNESKSVNLFYDEKTSDHISPLMKRYMAGQLYCLPHLLPMYAPTINSYKRLVEGAWAPTTLTWGIDNRTTALRALPTSSKAARLETRVVGSDVNPYLAMAACLASGLYGIENNLSLDDIPATVGNGYENFSNGKLPANLKDATDQMRESTVAKQLFGDEFVSHFTKTRDWEWKQFAQAVTDWEVQRYFEII